MFVYYFVDLRVEINFRREDSKKWGIDFEIVNIDSSAHWY